MEVFLAFALVFLTSMVKCQFEENQTPIGNETEPIVITSLFGILKSPGAPKPYPENVNLTYQIKFPNSTQKYTVTIVVLWMSVEYESTCKWDYLTIEYGKKPKLCGQIARQTYVVPDITGSLSVRFVSDFDASGCGFTLEYIVEVKPGNVEVSQALITDTSYAFGTKGPASDNNACVRAPCKNNGLCVPMGPYRKMCCCQGSFAGFQCQDELPTPPPPAASTACTPSTCSHGTCIDDVCDCYINYYGPKCEHFMGSGSGSGATLPACASFCKNGGTCFNKNGSPACICPFEHEGAKCEVEFVTF